MSALHLMTKDVSQVETELGHLIQDTFQEGYEAGRSGKVPLDTVLDLQEKHFDQTLALGKKQARELAIDEIIEKAQKEFGHKEYIGRMTLMEFFQSLSK